MNILDVSASHLWSIERPTVRDIGGRIGNQHRTATTSSPSPGLPTGGDADKTGGNIRVVVLAFAVEPSDKANPPPDTVPLPR
ncbi:hypothetical protein IU500_20780 [Nocardia terpenica]|uniref:hypothetical protein n=1 Tax=Nocardia terpenica TaxID=455432 RepID=UPI00189515E9|nr:hypothetical protein [Nocardia terpenica]MBF6064138.1 hypothetical protein [Nocardia terpenica]MBF6106471.1 hypothetical protein [Nocardia terpenica]MBF6113756.1 hypothetical protein [Nocardia terpenica]MBF6120620.1 hypothetical protein [Nocardia terpenica]MBF6154723.1 hypothetical protein [Nocardia terpenica]